MQMLLELLSYVRRFVEAHERIALALELFRRSAPRPPDDELVDWKGACDELGIVANTPKTVYSRIVPPGKSVARHGDVPQPDEVGQRGRKLWRRGTLRKVRESMACQSRPPSSRPPAAGSRSSRR